MKGVPLFALLGSLFGLTIIAPVCAGQPPDKAAPADSAEAVKQLVTKFYENLSAGKADTNRALFLNGDVAVVGIGRGEGADKAWQKKASSAIKWWQDDGAATHVVDSVEVELLDDALAVARVKLHTAFGIKVRSVFTLTSEGGSWRSASLVLETRFPDQK
jgi:hypothetical protein